MKDRKSKTLLPSEFPLLLRESIYAPKVLNVIGELPPEEFVGISMVGTRRPSPNAADLCRRLVFGLRGTKAVVISGLAQGIDSLCHQAALEAGLPTIAVLAQGLQTRIEGSRGELAKKILEAGGCLISQFDGDEPAYKGNFPARNRIISGMSKGTILVQSKLKGGALITADLCLKEDKPLWTIPGDFDSEVASGPNQYLDEGKASAIFKPESIASVIGLPKSSGQEIQSVSSAGCEISPEAIQFLKKYNGFKKTITELQGESTFKSPELLAILTELELAGFVHTEDNFQFYFNGVL